MEREILVSADALETRVALLEAGVVVEAAIERHGDRSHVGNIYKARVNRVLPGMQSAFLGIGLDRDAFLHVTDLVRPGRDPEDGDESPPPIETLLREGDTLLVQVVKEAIPGKGARVTSGIALPGRYLVLVPASRHVAISRKIADEEERARLKTVVEEVLDGTCGFIVRTAADGKGEKAIGEDRDYLVSIWRAIEEK
ncbi:MAG: ribonuclease E/G, partial [Acidobacteriota bacterium]